MLIINCIIFIIITFITIDILLIIKPKSKLKIRPLEYKFKSNKNTEEVQLIFEIKNHSAWKETMIPELNFELDLINEKTQHKINFKKEISIDDGYKKKNVTNYWPTIIIKANSSIKVYTKIIITKIYKNLNYIWLKILWENYGDFGLTQKQDCFLLNKSTDYIKKRKLIVLPINKNYEAIAIKTDVLGIFDDPIQTISNYCRDIIKANDILVIGETPLAIMQGRYLNPHNIEYTFFSKVLCYFFHPTSSLATACGMQLLINKIGVARITFSLIIGLFFKILGINGVFYRLSGPESSLIDDISGTVAPYDKSIVMGPQDPKNYCNKISKILKINSAVVDVNDLGGVKIIASSNKSINRLLKAALKFNPAGNGDQKTPIVLIREKHNLKI